MSGFDTVAGSKLYISTAAPTVTEGAGAAAAFALLTWVEVGRLTNIGSVVGREYATSSSTTIGDAQTREKKGSFKLPNAEFECEWAEEDAGQILIASASKDYSIPSFKMVKQDEETTRYFTAQVSKFVENNGTSDDAVKGAFTLLRQTDTVTA